MIVLSRRRFVKLVVAGTTAAIALPACGDNTPGPASEPPHGAFLDAHGWATIDAAADALLPGATAALAVRYIDNLLSAFDQTPARIFGGGPYSGRAPLPDAHGAATPTFPADAFATSLPLTRVQELAWRARIFGTAATPGADFNDGVLGPTVGYRDLYTAGIAALDAAAAPMQFVDLDADARLSLLANMQTTPFYQALLGHVLEGMFAAPEYGGNADLAGWQLARYDGDSMPLGHAFYDASIDAYVDRADQPTSTASPGDAPETFDEATLDLLTLISTGSGGKRFF